MPHDPVLRPWRTADAPALLRHYRAATDLHRELPELRDVGAARALIEERAAQDAWHYALVDNGVAVGNVSIGHVDRRHSFGWVSYWAAMPARGKGWMQRAVATLCDHVLFDDPQPLFRLELGHRLNNPASGRIAEAAGFVVEGIERQKLCYDGQRFDTRVLSRLVTDPRPQYQPLLLEAPGQQG